jgi:mRNA interferase MazF
MKTLSLKLDDSVFTESCDVMIDQLRAIDNKRLVKKAGSAPNDIILNIKENLKIIFDLE